MLEENHNLEKIIEDAKQYRWYSVPDMYMVEILDVQLDLFSLSSQTRKKPVRLLRCFMEWLEK